MPSTVITSHALVVLFIILHGVTLSSSLRNCRAAEPDNSGVRSEWQPLFNGRDFDGLYVFVEGKVLDGRSQQMFQIKDGMLHVYPDQPDGSTVTAGYIATREEFAYYHLSFEYKWGEKKFEPRVARPRDAGLIYHFAGADAVWPRGIECQVQEKDTGDCFLVKGAQITTMVNPATRADQGLRYLPAEKGGTPREVGGPSIMRIIKESTHEIPGDWNTVEVIVCGAESVTHIVNGEVVFRGTNAKQLGEDDSWAPLPYGKLLFQAEYAELYYRNIKIRPIAAGPLHPRKATAPVPVPDDLHGKTH